MSERLSAAEQDQLSGDQFAFPEQRKEPLTDASHVRNAIARFDQVEGVSDAERDRAWDRIVDAAKKFGVQVSEEGWRDLRHGGEALGNCEAWCFPGVLQGSAGVVPVPSTGSGVQGGSAFSTTRSRALNDKSAQLAPFTLWKRRHTVVIGGLGKIRNPWGVIGLSIITLGIYFIYWQYASFKELKDSSQEGNRRWAGTGLRDLHSDRELVHAAF